jgi:hypothetical protein
VEKNFAQTMTLRSQDPDALIALARAWDIQQATSDIMGYIGMRLLADREDPGRYVMVAEFAVVDPDVSAADEALRNNDRPETQAAAARLREVAQGDIEYRDFDELYRTFR